MSCLVANTSRFVGIAHPIHPGGAPTTVIGMAALKRDDFSSKSSSPFSFLLEHDFSESGPSPLWPLAPPGSRPG